MLNQHDAYVRVSPRGVARPCLLPDVFIPLDALNPPCTEVNTSLVGSRLRHNFSEGFRTVMVTLFLENACIV